jgi:cyclic pyranopterin phosphate synthase
LETLESYRDLVDSFGRVARKLRLSITDKCNFRCNFCMPETPEWLPNEKVLTFEEITRVVEILSRFGVGRVRISGGEPLVRNDVEKLIQKLRAIQAIKKIGITTNGFFLKEKAKALYEAGLDSVTVSLHSLRPDRFAFVTQRDAHGRVVEGIAAAKEAGFENVKVNSVIVRGYNDDEILDFASMAYEQGLNVRFIEYMPFDGKKTWAMEKVVSGAEMLARIRSVYRVIPLEREAGSTAINYKFADSSGEVGIITSMTKPFCSDCDRLRLTADGKLIPCLFDTHEYDISGMLRSQASDLEIGNFLKKTVKLKAPGVESLLKNDIELHHIRPMYKTGG